MNHRPDAALAQSQVAVSPPWEVKAPDRFPIGRPRDEGYRSVGSNEGHPR